MRCLQREYAQLFALSVVLITVPCLLEAASGKEEKVLRVGISWKALPIPTGVSATEQEAFQHALASVSDGLSSLESLAAFSKGNFFNKAPASYSGDILSTACLVFPMGREVTSWLAALNGRSKTLAPSNLESNLSALKFGMDLTSVFLESKLKGTRVEIHLLKDDASIGDAVRKGTLDLAFFSGGVSPKATKDLEPLLVGHSSDNTYKTGGEKHYLVIAKELAPSKAEHKSADPRLEACTQAMENKNKDLNGLKSQHLASLWEYYNEKYTQPRVSDAQGKRIYEEYLSERKKLEDRYARAADDLDALGELEVERDWYHANQRYTSALPSEQARILAAHEAESAKIRERVRCVKEAKSAFKTREENWSEELSTMGTALKGNTLVLPDTVRFSVANAVAGFAQKFLPTKDTSDLNFENTQNWEQTYTQLLNDTSGKKMAILTEDQLRFFEYLLPRQPSPVVAIPLPEEHPTPSPAFWSSPKGNQKLLEEVATALTSKRGAPSEEALPIFEKMYGISYFRRPNSDYVSRVASFSESEASLAAAFPSRHNGTAVSADECLPPAPIPHRRESSSRHH